MLKTLSALLLALLLTSCSPTVVRVLKEPDLTVTFYDTPCTNTQVLAIAGQVGVPTPVVQALRAGEVVFTDGTPKRQLCYKDSNDGSVTFIIDDSGSMGNLQLK